MSETKSWLLNVVYFSQFGCCNPLISQFFNEKSRYQLCHFRWMGQNNTNQFVGRHLLIMLIRKNSFITQNYVFFKSDTKFINRYNTKCYSIAHFLADWVGFIQINKVVVNFVSHISAKSGTIGTPILTYLGEIAVSPDCNIQIAWNKRNSKAKSYYCECNLISCRNFFLFTSNEGTLSLPIFFPYILYIS